MDFERRRDFWGGGSRFPEFLQITAPAAAAPSLRRLDRADHPSEVSTTDHSPFGCRETVSGTD
jgi:hypothetical protein